MERSVRTQMQVPCIDERLTYERAGLQIIYPYGEIECLLTPHTTMNSRWIGNLNTKDKNETFRRNIREFHKFKEKDLFFCNKTLTTN